jgi:hypothetical protein
MNPDAPVVTVDPVDMDVSQLQREVLQLSPCADRDAGSARSKARQGLRFGEYLVSAGARTPVAASQATGPPVGAEGRDSRCPTE